MFKHNLAFKLNLQREDVNGRYPLRLRATIHGKPSYVASGIMLKKDEWDDQRQLVVKRSNAVTLNNTLRTMFLEKENAMLEADKQGQTVSRIPKSQDGDFLVFCKRQIALMAKKDADGTRRHKGSDLNKLREFKTKIPFNRINTALLEEFEAFCFSLGNQSNTVWRSLRFVRQMCRLAIEEGYIDKKKIKGFAWPKYEDPERDYLSLAELDKIEAFRNKTTSPSVQKVCDHFLFSAYTGLRYGDVRDFTMDRVKGVRMVLRTEKTGEQVTIALHPRLSRVLERMSPEVMTNQKFNEYLKIGLAGAEVNKDVTMHTARHTFAVAFLELGGSIEALQKLLGHRRIQTTMIYAKIVNKRLDDEMGNTWGKV